MIILYMIIIMDIKNQCPRCLNVFASTQRLSSHLKLQSKCYVKPKKFVCQFCQKKFTRKSYLDKHTPKHKLSSMTKLKLKIPDSYEEQIEKFSQLIELQNQKIDELIEKQNQIIEKPYNVTNNNNNNLQIICVGQDDNYLDMLTERMGFDKALRYVENCALSSVVGDCKLIENIYINNQSSSIYYVDKAKTKILYFDENNSKIISNKTQLMRKLANNLQNTYLKSVNYLINDNLDHQRCPNEFLQNHDL